MSFVIEFDRKIKTFKEILDYLNDEQLNIYRLI